MELIICQNAEQLNISLAIRKEVFILEQNVPVELELDQYDKPNSKCTHYLIKDNDIFVATFRTIEEHPYELHLQRFAVLKDYRKKGYGSFGLKALEELAIKNYNSIVLNAQITAIEFYEKNGYSCISDFFYDANILHKTMKKELMIIK